jgi:hypothetical protein
MKQTAVEWFFKCLFEEHGEFTFEQIKTDNPKLWEIYQQAKEMDKQQIILSHINGQSEFDKGAISENTKKLATEYYNQTFKQK